MRFVFDVPRRFPTVNVWHGGPAWKYKRERDAWLREFPPTTALNRATGRRAVFITRIYPKAPGQKRYDDDNLDGGAKPVLDALRRLGWLKGDSPAHCTKEVDQRHPAPGEKAPSTRVVILDVDPEPRRRAGLPP